ncbi:MAG: hypothetical protein HOL15_04795 [Nitrospinaceae bacterium]|jgi:hypothetical protein|nr:hypothetical protein [Nitrospina sp.]MBT5376110.1 hypothetical protein [Nitrospinaceae bacterium]MBT5869390.1 hypothetical protein [Nitrospinaceae bacterium]MBT6347158.1 hypothetical protein [Nitrospina sp.]
MEFAQVQGYCKEASQIGEREGIHTALSYLIGERFGAHFKQLKDARRKLQFLYTSNQMSEDHPLNQGGRSLKMSYALTVQEHYRGPLEQVKHLEALVADFAKGIADTFSHDQIKNYLESSPGLEVNSDSQKNEDTPSDTSFSVDDLLMEAEEILAFEDIKKMLLQKQPG